VSAASDGNAAEPSGELPVVATDHVDLDVGMPVDAGAPAGWLADRVEEDTRSEPTVLLEDVGSADPQLEETGTVPSMPIDDENHTVTIVEMDLLQQDYEEEFTRTQELSRELLEAVANLEAARTAHAADTVTSEMPRYAESEAPNSETGSDAAPPRARRRK
jgi:hypothetical protein